ncbi:hypothetical protein EVG20_g521 [Dentipellis fragilis]|uniref:Uncharacterized protein n=1 Tax=Dentipellis fragilis TaxID=205917 RepID=A0A4Y9ZEC9_9AGAM|nr:hypothetical protein EVG20_g521 [Dentipellis fragilis]
MHGIHLSGIPVPATPPDTPPNFWFRAGGNLDLAAVNVLITATLVALSLPPVRVLGAAPDIQVGDRLDGGISAYSSLCSIQEAALPLSCFAAARQTVLQRSNFPAFRRCCVP